MRELRPERLSVFELVDRQYEHANHGSTKKIILNFPPAAVISSACGRIFSQLEREDDYQRLAARKAWLIKATVLQTMLEFDDSRLGIIDMAEAMKNFASTIPAIGSAVEVLVKAINSLVATPRNPKREWFMSELNTQGQAGAPNGILIGLQGASTPGWPATLSLPDGFVNNGVVLVRNRKELKEKIFRKLVIPGTLKFTARPLVYDILYGGRYSELIFLAYSSEVIYFPQPIPLPVDGLFKTSIRELNPISLEIHDAPDEKIDQWANESIWSELRSLNIDLTPLSDNDVFIQSRFVLFADGSGTFLPDNKSVTELSELFDRNRNQEIEEDRMPRKSIRDLEESDLVMLRLSGSGDYLDDVANGLMEKEGHSHLRSEATEWKLILYRSIKKYGEGVVAKTGKENGLQLRSANYLWAWAGDDVIAPYDFNTFLKLIETIAHLDPDAFDMDIKEYARIKWEKMELVKSFHARAGSTIRAKLLSRVNELIKERRHIETVEIIELPGVTSGKMGLLRVAAVDTKPVSVPESKLFHVFPMRER